MGWKVVEKLPIQLHYPVLLVPLGDPGGVNVGGGCVVVVGGGVVWWWWCGVGFCYCCCCC